MDVAKRKYVPKSVRLMDQVREILRLHRYAFNTEKSYVSWIFQYIHFNNKKHSKGMGKHEIESFLNYLAVNRSVKPAKMSE